MHDYEKLMKKCIKLGEKGRGKVSPNPLVGCIVLDSRGEIIAKGYHHKYGEAHAERDALLKLKNGEEKNGVLIVNLEPCSHHGKTPPCADLIIERGIKKVVIGCTDSNPKVNGNGIKKLKNSGINVISGILEKECRELNEIFFCDNEEKRIFVALKTATTIDGKIASHTGDSKWITSDKAREKAHKLRGYYDAILTSSSTILADNPNMEHKTKIILDKDFKTDFDLNIYKQGKVILVTRKRPDKYPDNVVIIEPKITNGKIDLNNLLKKLYDNGIKSIFVEAGGNLSGSFIRENLVDKIYHFIAPKILNDNRGLSCFNGDKTDFIKDSKGFKVKNIEKFGDDIMITYKKEK